MKPIVAINPADNANAAAAATHHQTKADAAKRLEQLAMHVNPGAQSAASGSSQTQHAAPKPTTDRSHLEAAAKPLSKPRAPKDHDAIMADADKALAALRNIPVNQKPRNNHSATAAKGQGASTSSEQVGNTVEITQMAAASLSPLAANQGADHHDDD